MLSAGRHIWWGCAGSGRTQSKIHAAKRVYRTQLLSAADLGAIFGNHVKKKKKKGKKKTKTLFRNINNLLSLVHCLGNEKTKKKKKKTVYDSIFF